MQLAQNKSQVFLAAKKRLNLLKNPANFTVSFTLLPHSWFDSYKSLICMRKIFLKRILCLFKKVSYVGKNISREDLDTLLNAARSKNLKHLMETGFVPISSTESLIRPIRLV